LIDACMISNSVPSCHESQSGDGSDSRTSSQLGAPTKTSSTPRRPASTKVAASTPWWAGMPAKTKAFSTWWRSRNQVVVPDASCAAYENRYRWRPSSNLSSTPAAPEAQKVPTTPWLLHRGPARSFFGALSDRPTRPPRSYPAATARMNWSPEAPVRSASASAAGTVAHPG
jgi:hypothetical protein